MSALQKHSQKTTVTDIVDMLRFAVVGNAVSGTVVGGYTTK